MYNFQTHFKSTEQRGRDLSHWNSPRRKATSNSDIKIWQNLVTRNTSLYLKLNSILETFVDKSRFGKYYRNVYKSDYHDDVDILTCEDIHVNDMFTACSVDVIFCSMRIYNTITITINSEFCDIKTAAAIKRSFS